MKSNFQAKIPRRNKADSQFMLAFRKTSTNLQYYSPVISLTGIPLTKIKLINIIDDNIRKWPT